MNDRKSLLLTMMILGIGAGLIGCGFYLDEQKMWIPGFLILVLPFVFWSLRSDKWGAYDISPGVFSD